jgi:Flp pilus assembly protein TadG
VAGSGISGARQNQKGATLVHMAIGMVAIMASSALVIDYGIFWVARRQAQNSADAGALAAAIALAFDDATDLTVTGAGKKNAVAAAQTNLVWGAQPSVDPATDVTIANGLPGCDPDEMCVRVDVYRNVTRGNPLPTFFARLVGVNTQDVQASATAKVLTGNASECLKPFAILDKWDEFDETTGGAGSESEYQNGLLDPDWSMDSSFDKYPQNPADPVEADFYQAPALCPPDAVSCDPGTGYRLFDDAGNPVDYGREVKIHTGSQDQTSSGFFLPVRLDPGDSGAADFCASIKQCRGGTHIIGEEISTENGNMVGPTVQCLFTDPDSLYNQDPTAHWEPDYYGQGKGAVISDDYGPNQSPRIIALPVINPDEFFATDPNGHTSMTVRNMLGFFISHQEGQGGQTLTVGRFINVPGIYAGGNVVSPNNSFIKQIVLVR